LGSFLSASELDCCSVIKGSFGLLLRIYCFMSFLLFSYFLSNFYSLAFLNLQAHLLIWNISLFPENFLSFLNFSYSINLNLYFIYSQSTVDLSYLCSFGLWNCIFFIFCLHQKSIDFNWCFRQFKIHQKLFKWLNL
jgi:hypothetical protein